MKYLCVGGSPLSCAQLSFSDGFSLVGWWFPQGNSKCYFPKRKGVYRTTGATSPLTLWTFKDWKPIHYVSQELEVRMTSRGQSCMLNLSGPPGLLSLPFLVNQIHSPHWKGSLHHTAQLHRALGCCNSKWFYNPFHFLPHSLATITVF